jgi:hypothetical protein
MKKTFYLLSFLIIGINTMSQNTNKYLESVNQWHSERIADLKTPNGWLNLEGLFWLHKGNNTFGSAQESDCFYDNKNFPTYLGDFIYEGDSVQWVNKVDQGALVNNQLIQKGQKVTVFNFANENARPAIFTLGQFTWVVIKREDKIGIRFRNLKAKTLTEFKGIDRFAVNGQWCIKARLEKPVDHFIMITNIIGQTAAQKKAGILYFSIDNKEYSLDVIDEGGSQYFITFADGTSGKSTYGAGRFINLDKPDAAGNTYIDFNLAYNPPCAFTAFATCPLPPPQNRLTVEITAGEKKYGHH